jgi:CelD/BcsL family acetyltransferase involved in cellulose biosynthesis
MEHAARIGEGLAQGLEQPWAKPLRLPPLIGELTLEVHRSLASAERDWRAFECRAAGHPYQRFHWQSAWHARLCAAGVQPFIVVLRHDGRIRMLLPLAIESRLGMSALVPMGAPVCDYHAPLIDPEFADRLTPGIMRNVLMAIVELAGADYALLTSVPPMVGPVRNPISALAVRPFSADAHGTRPGTDWNAFYAGRRSAKTRSRLRGKERALAKLGPIDFAEVTDQQERAALAVEILALKASQLNATAGAFNTIARADVQGFYLSLATHAEDVFVFKLSAGGMLAAAVIALVHQGCFYYQLAVYPDHAQRFSPGHLLIGRLMEWAIDRGCTRFDFTIGDEAYKAEWCDETWPLGCGAWPRTLRGRIGAVIALAGIAAIRHIKRRPALFRLAAGCRTALGRVRQKLRAAFG